MTKKAASQPKSSPSSNQHAGLGEDFIKYLLAMFKKVISEVDEEAALATVQRIKDENLGITTEQLVERLIRDKCLKAAAVGALTSSAAILPGLGTIASLTAGVAADIGAMFKFQAELVLEIAAAHEHKLSEDEKSTAVMLVTGTSAGANQALKQVSLHLTEQYAQKWVAHALPLAGVAASASLNAFTTYVIGNRADAYFRLGPKALDDIGSTFTSLLGVDVGAVGDWLSAHSHSLWHSTYAGASYAASVAASAGHATSDIVISGAGSVAGYVSSGASAAGSAVVSGASATGSTVASGASTASSAVVSGASAVGNAVASGASAAGSAVVSGASTVGSAVTSGASAAGSAVLSGASAVGEAGKKILHRVSGRGTAMTQEAQEAPPES